ncbi:MAG: hypothetical protein MI747_00030 [Desulfobacterales bacterium]|nr:hypothetical protein [Desulfobacterales bacterium]
MGLDPLIRRAFSFFDPVLYVGIILGCVGLHFGYVTCPKCNRRMKWKGSAAL